MRTIELKKGRDLHLPGSPEQRMESGPAVKRVALLGPDYIGLRPGMLVAEGDRVGLGQALFCDKRDERIRFTAPAAGRVTGVHRGEKRALLAVEVALEGRAEESFAEYPAGRLERLTRAEVTENLLASGLWTALRTRPFSQVPLPDAAPDALFVTAIDTRPLAADPGPVVAEREGAFTAGLQVLKRLTDGPLFLCQKPGFRLPTAEGVTAVGFAGPHPAGLPGTHIHCLDPVAAGRSVWHIGYQDVIAVGHLFTTGRLDSSRIVALGGPGMQRPRLVRTLLGAALGDLLRDELHDAARPVSGSVLDGRPAEGPLAFLGRYHLQVCALTPEPEFRVLDWLRPGRLPVTRSLGGGRRAIFPVEAYEKVVPLDLVVSYLLRALAAGDAEEAQELGCLELDEEDLALCSFICPGKNEYGPLLRAILEQIEKEG